MSIVSISDDVEMGSWLSEAIRKRRKKGFDLKTKIGGGVLSFSKPGEPGAPAAPGAGSGGFMDKLKNPYVIGGIAAAGLLVVLVIVKARKRNSQKVARR